MPKRLTRRAVFLALSVFFISFAASAKQGETAVPSAIALKLWEHPYWLKLLHYEKTRGGHRSLAQGERLFVSPDGATNPKSELLATVAALESNKYLEQREEGALCAFPARLRWLKTQLNLSDSHFPTYSCSTRDDWQKTLNPTSATLVFPDAHISSPGSMFGHTLLRVNGAVSGSRSGLLAYAVNYAADVRGASSLEYAVKGITGGFPGNFGVFPYYTKVKEYARIEQRDLWEYPLELSDLELTRLMEHLWELKEVPFRYFFFDQNCSWQLLSLLEVAKPGIELTIGMDTYAIPIDTVRRLQQHSLIVEKPFLRPSRRRALEAARRKMSAAQRQSVMHLVEGKLLPLDPAITSMSEHQQILVLDTAYELLHIRFRSGDYKRSEALPRGHAMLRARSTLGLHASVEAEQTNQVSPDQSHASGRYGIAAGDDALGPWIGASYRPAFHDLLDPDAGFLPGYGIDFGLIKLRHYTRAEKFRLDSLTILSATSRNSWTSWAKPSSWNLTLGAKRPDWIRGADIDPSIGFNVSGELGITLGSSRNHLFMALANEAHWGKLLGKNGRIASGPKIEAKLSTGSHFSTVLAVQHSYSLAGLKVDNLHVSAAAQVRLDHRTGIRLAATHSDADTSRSDTQIKISWLRYL